MEKCFDSKKINYWLPSDDSMSDEEENYFDDSIISYSKILLTETR